MKIYNIFLFLILLSIASCEENTTNMTNTSPLEVNDPALYKIISREAVIDTLAEGFTWSEGPVWVEEEQMLLWTDVPNNIVWSWKEGQGKKKYIEPSGYTGKEKREGANGLIINQRGQLVLCQHGNRSVATMNTSLATPQSIFTILADNYKGKKLNSPNDIVQDKVGTYWFTDPPYGLPKKMEDPAKELDFQGVYRFGHLPNKKELELMTDELTYPNGLAFNPDESVLYVAVSDPKRAIWMKYNLDAQNNFVGEGTVFFDATKWVATKKGLPDGLKVRADGIIFATGPGGVLVFTPEGKHLGTINTGQATANCALNKAGTMLYMTADNYVMQIPLLPLEN